MADTYKPASLETAACLWEAILEVEAVQVTNLSTPMQQVAQHIYNVRQAHGTWALRVTVLSWVDAVDSAWEQADKSAGEYGGAFDWEFIPYWLRLNVVWHDDASLPTLVSPMVLPESQIPPAAPEQKTPVAVGENTRHPLETLAPDLRAWLVDEMGMEAEIMGGGAFGLRHCGPAGWSLLLTQCEGGGLPSWDDWHVGTYAPDEGAGEDICVWEATSADSLGATASPITLRAAVSMACALVDTICADAPPPHLSNVPAGE